MNARLLFRIFYKTLYVVLGICLLGLLIITPADAIHQSLKNKQLYNIFEIGAAYAATAVVGVVIWAFRIWTNKTVIASIPKSWIPVEKGDVNKSVRAMIADGYTRSAIIAWDSRPRIENMPATVVSEPGTLDPVVKLANTQNDEKKKSRLLHKRRSGRAKQDDDKDEGNPDGTIQTSQQVPMWGVIAHKGWSSPMSKDLPNLEYTKVISELPHLIEAKAVSVAPPDSESTANPPMPDIRAVALLQRPASMGLRDYITHLLSLEVITSSSTATDFLGSYEYARFSSQPLTEDQFRDLMKLFADLLRSMQALSLTVLASLDIYPSESELDDVPSSATPSTQRSMSLASSHSTNTHSGSEGTIRTALSRHTGTFNTSGTSTTRNFPEFATAPATPSRRPVRTPSSNSFAQSRRPYTGSSGSSLSLASSQGSVIRLSTRDEEDETGMSYTLTIPPAR